MVFVRQGMYKGGIFKFSVQIPKEFPDGTPPVSEEMPVGLHTFVASPLPLSPPPPQCITFDHKVYHPQVDPSSGEVNLTNGESPRKPRLPQHVYQVLECMRSLFFTVDPTGATNQEAEKL